MSSLIGKDEPPVFRVCGDEVKRVARVEPVKSLESGTAMFRSHAAIVASVCDRRQPPPTEWWRLPVSAEIAALASAVTDRRYKGGRRLATIRASQMPRKCDSSRQKP